ncbi:MAG: toll/interleukin-1 receptor domain-containing protein [Clostridia bacterium]|nr:toll/interleukin-1 receptor domain-containing protein [Clostridia bacterium]
MRRYVFNEGSFSSYKVSTLNEFREPILRHDAFSSDSRITVFISHKHSDLEELRGVIGFLEKEYSVKCYIDSRDPSMPQITSGVTASKIKERIKSCKKFILLATEDAIESKWCNWELGFGDANKFKDHIALFPIKKADVSEREYKGNEYMQIYPYITYFGQGEKFSDGETITPGYYIREIKPAGNRGYLTPLRKWFES